VSDLLPAEEIRTDPCWEPTRLPTTRRSRIRVVEVLATGTNGGAQESLYSLVTRMDRDRFDVSVVALSPGSSVRKLERAGIPVCVIDSPDDDEAVAQLSAYLTTVGADVIHNHMFRAEVIGTRAALAVAATGRRRPLIVSTVHSSRIRSREDRELLRALTPQMDQLIAVSTSIVQKINEDGRTGAPVALIHNGVDLVRYAHQEPCCTLREEYGMDPDAQIVGVVARLEPEKGHATLLEAWRRVVRDVPNAWLLVIGEGSRREALEAQARDLGIANRVVFTGRRDDVPAVVAGLDVAVLPSYREALGLSILEAMALGRPVVASNIGGIPEMVEDGVTGLLVPPGDAPALATAIIRLLEDHQLADMLGRAGHDLVHERFCIERVVAAIEAIYERAADLQERRTTA
jgi:glycosyltransferase involved in cell wall biosynthesis